MEGVEEVVFKSGLTSRLALRVILIYAAIAILIFALSAVTEPGLPIESVPFLLYFIQPAAVLWVLLSVFTVPILIGLQRKGLTTFCVNRIERRTRGETKVYSYDQIEDADFSGLLTINESTAAQMPGSSASLPIYNYLQYFSFRLDGAGYRFSARTKTIKGDSFRDFMIERLVPEKE